MVESIFIQHLLAVQLGSAAQGEDEVFLDAPEVIFRLSVSEAEYGARVCAAKDVRDAVSVAIDRDVAGEGIRLREDKSLKCEEDAENESESSDHLVDIKPQRGTKSTKFSTCVAEVELLWLGPNRNLGEGVPR